MHLVPGSDEALNEGVPPALWRAVLGLEVVREEQNSHQWRRALRGDRNPFSEDDAPRLVHSTNTPKFGRAEERLSLLEGG